VIIISQRQREFSSNYSLSAEEYKKLISILFQNGDSGYSTFLIILLKELKGNIDKVLRILNIGINGNKKIIPVSLYNSLIKSIQEAIILSNYGCYIEEDGFISIVGLSRLERFKLAFIDRQTIIRTFKKYNINYTKRK